MPNKSLRKLLIEIAQENQESKIAKILAFYYPTIKKQLTREGVFEFIQSKIETSDEINLEDVQMPDDEIVFENYENRDYRIKSFEIASLRGIPDADEQGTPFGIDFTDNGHINNAIILANNGVGKSSIFAGLEMVYAQEIGEKQLRTTKSPNQEGYNNYLNRFGSERSPFCKILTKEGYGDLNKPFFESEQLRKILNPSNHFVSDYDIYSYGRINFMLVSLYAQRK